MTLRADDKKQVVAEVAKIATSAKSAIALDYHGIEANQMTNLRRQAREQNIYLRVIKNNLARRALTDTQYACMTEHLSGPMMFAFSIEDPAAAARVVNNFHKETDKLKVKLIALDGELRETSELKRLATLPTYEQSISLLMAVMKAPIEKLVKTIKAPVLQTVRSVAAIRDQKK